MADRPILFSAPMVCALLDSRKTQTRRTLNPQPYDFVTAGKRHWNASGCVGGRICISDAHLASLHHWNVGDRLYVREEYYQFGHWEARPELTNGGRQKWAFVGASPMLTFDPPADFLVSRDKAFPGLPRWYKRLGRFMPRKYSRLTLTVTDVRVERLNDCSEADAIAEGVAEYPCEGPFRGPDATYWTAERGHPEHGARPTPVGAYRALWETINGEGSWEANPWIVAITFTVEQRNIDA